MRAAALPSLSWSRLTAAPQAEDTPMAQDLSVVDRIITSHGKRGGTLIAILSDIQRECSYLPKEAVELVAERLAVPISQVYGVCTFYRAFSLVPRGRHVVQVCMGTACHVRGAPLILDEFQRILGIKAGTTTEDGQFTLETVNCVGACALGPVATVDGAYEGSLTMAKVSKVVDVLARKDKE
jgi:NADH-quinone oxidoreductase subunit E